MSSSSSSSSSDSDIDDSLALSQTLTSLNSSLSALESTFVQPLLTAGTLKETLAGLGGELERGKMEVGLGYLICDLVWSESIGPAEGDGQGGKGSRGREGKEC